MGKYPKRILFYRGQSFNPSDGFANKRSSLDGVSEGQFATVINEELPLIRSMPVDPYLTFS